tara:strand:- start:1021 stop:1182 length:162 start_codon:yes stop_codon:yes gene_type:complete
MKSPYIMSDGELLEVAKLTEVIIKRLKFLRVKGIPIYQLDYELRDCIDKVEAT